MATQPAAEALNAAMDVVLHPGVDKAKMSKVVHQAMLPGFDHADPRLGVTLTVIWGPMLSKNRVWLVP